LISVDIELQLGIGATGTVAAAPALCARRPGARTGAAQITHSFKMPF
jgi:hypothetical protein